MRPAVREELRQLCPAGDAAAQYLERVAEAGARWCEVFAQRSARAGTWHLLFVRAGTEPEVLDATFAGAGDARAVAAGMSEYRDCSQQAPADGAIAALAEVRAGAPCDLATVGAWLAAVVELKPAQALWIPRKGPAPVVEGPPPQLEAGSWLGVVPCPEGGVRGLAHARYLLAHALGGR